MEKEKLEIIKPEFKGDIKAEIKGIAEIEDNIQEVNVFANKLNEYYKGIVWNEEEVAAAKEEKANVNKFKDKVAEFRKNIVAEYNKPIEVFQKTAKETEALLKETYDSINNQIKKYEDETKENIKTKCIEFYEELKQSENIDFTKFEDLKLNITLGTQTKTGELTKKTKEEIINFIEKIKSDLALIDEEEYKTEILVEYKKTLNASSSILEIKKRKRDIEIELEKQQELIKIQEEEKKVIKKVDDAVDSVRYTEIPKVEVEKYNITFKVKGTLEELKKLKEFLVNGGYEYEQSK